MKSTTMIAHMRRFEELIGDADRVGEGDETAYALLYAALAVAAKRLGTASTIRSASDFLSEDAQRH